MRLSKAIMIGALSAAFSTSLYANDASAPFDLLDVDSSSGLTLTELQAVAPTLTEETFANYDADQSGELTQDEFAAWRSLNSQSAEDARPRSQ